MKVVVTGTRGIPRIQGGVETHCEHLYPRLVKMGCDVTVLRRSCYVTDDNRVSEYEGVHLIDLYAPRRKSFEAIVHTFLAVVKARRMCADVVHIHAVGPSLMAPLARLLGLKVVCTNHGPDYERQKWGFAARSIIKLGEWCQAHFAHRIISISHVISDTLRERYGREQGVDLIYNGVEPPVIAPETDYIDSLGLTPRHYVVALARFVPEKRLDWLVKAFAASSHEGWRLVLAGDADHPDEYSEELKRLAAEHDVVLTGFIRGERLNQLMSHAGLFALPSTHEGLPISLLEAMSYGLDVIVSDIAANRLPQLDAEDFFHVESLDELTAALSRKMASPRRREYDLSPYDWDHIAEQTLEVYRSLEPQ